MAPRFCNGTRLGAEYMDTDVDALMGPLWVVTDTLQWLARLPQSLAIANRNGTEWVSG
jgi:hypothetical protein